MSLTLWCFICRWRRYFWSMRRPDRLIETDLVILTTSNYSVGQNLKTGYFLFTESSFVFTSMFLRSCCIFLIVNWLICRVFQEKPTVFRETVPWIKRRRYRLAKNNYIRIWTVTEIRYHICVFTVKYILKSAANLCFLYI
jgi:hypothetical protein